MIELSLNDRAPNTADLAFAGDTFNTAIYLKRTAPALQVAFATKLGSDKISDRMIATMRAEELNTDPVARSEVSLPGLYAIVTDPDGERSFMYWRGASAARELFEPPELSFDTLQSFDLIYFSAITLAILPPNDRARFLDWLPEFRADGGRVAFDSNFRAALWPDLATARDQIEAAWRQTDIALPSMDDEQAVFGDANESALIQRLHRFGVTSGVIKRREKGPIALDGTRLPAFTTVEKIVDSTAAGDSFNGAYLAAKLLGHPEGKCLQAGHDLACKVLGVRGAIMSPKPIKATIK